MKWLVEEYDDHVKELVAEIEKQGHTCDFIKYYDMIKDSNYTGTGLPKTKGNFDELECVLFYGSIQLAGWLMRHRKWIPTVWYSYDKYKYSHFASKLGQHLLNNEFVLLPKGLILDRRFDLFNQFGFDHNLFIRPDNGTKSFGGKVFQLETFEKDWNNATHLMEDHELVVISRPWKIGKEWRFICTGNEIITGSQYKDSGSAEIMAGYDSWAYDKCLEVIKEGYHPDPMYTVDIGKCGNDEVPIGDHLDHYFLIEINNFCCSGLYACDLEKIVSTASALAIKEHQQYYNEYL